MPAEEVTLARVFRGIKVLEVMKINHLGPVHVGRSYLGYRENISISPCCEIIWKVALRSYWTKSFLGYRLLTGEISVTEIIFIPYEHNFRA